MESGNILNKVRGTDNTRYCKDDELEFPVRLVGKKSTAFPMSRIASLSFFVPLPRDHR